MKVSVILPFYNPGFRLVTAIESVVQQSHLGEIILVNDGSTDESKHIARDFEYKYDSIVLLENKINSGAAAARNKALLKAKFPLVAFLDADDYYLPNRFSKSVELLSEKNNSKIGAIYGVTRNSFKDNRVRMEYSKIFSPEVDQIYFESQNNTNCQFRKLALAKSGSIHLNSITIRKSIIGAIGYFDENLRQMQDTDYILRLTQYCQIMALPDMNPISVRCVHTTNRVFDSKEREYSRHIFLRKWLNISSCRYDLSVFIHFLRSYLGEHPQVISKSTWTSIVATKFAILLRTIFVFKNE